MRFYKVEGLVPESPEDNGEVSRWATRDDVRCTAMRGERFNQDLNGQAYYFISAGLEDTRRVRLGIVSTDSGDVRSQLAGYLEASGLELAECKAEEITL